MAQLPENRFSFTSRRIDEQQPREREYIVRDADVSQLVCRIRPNGKKSLEVRTGYLGENWSQKLCDFSSAVSIAEVRKSAAQILLRLNTGDDPKKEKQVQKECMTLGELMAWYVDDAKTRGLKSLCQVELIFKVHIEPSLGNRKLLDINTGDLSRLAKPLLAEGKKTQTNRVISFIARLYNFAARKHGYRGDNPTHHWKYEKEQPSMKFMDKATFEKFIAAVKQIPLRPVCKS